MFKLKKNMFKLNAVKNIFNTVSDKKYYNYKLKNCNCNLYNNFISVYNELKI